MTIASLLILICLKSSAVVFGQTGNYCGWYYDDAATKCATECPGGDNDECIVNGVDNGESCFEDVVCQTIPPTMTPVYASPPLGSYSYYRRCGESYDLAVSVCGSYCPQGFDSECPEGEYCFNDVLCSPSGFENRCGYDFTHAQESCGVPCPGGTDEECYTGEYCFKDIECSLSSIVETNVASTGVSQCGTSYGSACGTECPNGTDAECPDDEYCFPAEACGAAPFAAASLATLVILFSSVALSALTV